AALIAVANSFGVKYPKLLCGRSSLYSFFHAAIFRRASNRSLKPAHRQTFFPQPSVKTLDPRILRRLARLNVQQLDLPLDTPGQKMPAGQLRPVVAADGCGIPRSAMISSSTRVTLRLAKLVSTSKPRHSRVQAST